MKNYTEENDNFVDACKTAIDEDGRYMYESREILFIVYEKDGDIKLSAHKRELPRQLLKSFWLLNLQRCIDIVNEMIK